MFSESKSLGNAPPPHKLTKPPKGHGIQPLQGKRSKPTAPKQQASILDFFAKASQEMRPPVAKGQKSISDFFQAKPNKKQNPLVKNTDQVLSKSTRALDQPEAATCQSVALTVKPLPVPKQCRPSVMKHMLPLLPNLYRTFHCRRNQGTNGKPDQCGKSNSPQPLMSLLSPRMR